MVVHMILCIAVELSRVNAEFQYKASVRSSFSSAAWNPEECWETAAEEEDDDDDDVEDGEAEDGASGGKQR
jgi:hypothetical protein